MSTPSRSADGWPQNAVPESWVNELFRRMSRMWGNAFIDKWPAEDLDGVKVEWAKGLRKLSNAELKAGVDALMTQKFPPSLPDFYALCKMRRLVEAASQPALSDFTRADPNEVQANLKRMREALAPLAFPKEPNAEWAYRLLMRAKSDSGAALSYEVIRCASDAISSKAGRKVVEDCIDAELKTEYETIRTHVVDNYRMRGRKLWDTK